MPERPAPNQQNRQHGAPRSSGERFLRYTLKVAIVIAVVFYFLVAVLAVGLRYVVVPHIDEWRPQIAGLASRIVGSKIEIGRLSGHWQGPAPVIDADGILIHEVDGSAGLRVAHVKAVFAWRSLLRLAPTLASLEVSGAQMLIERSKTGVITVAGIRHGSQAQNPYRVLDWLLAQDALIVHEATVTWHDEGRGAAPVTFDKVGVALFNDGHLHQFGLQASSRDPGFQSVDMRARFRHGLLGYRGDWHTWNGDAFLNTGEISLPFAARYISLPIGATSGTMAGSAWLRFANGRMEEVSGTATARALGLNLANASQPARFGKLAASFAARRSGDTYAAAVRDLTLEIDDQPPLPDGTPVVRTLDVARFYASYRAGTLLYGERFALAGDALDVGLMSDLARTLPLPVRWRQALSRFDPRGFLYDYAIGWERLPPRLAAPAPQPQSAQASAQTPAPAASAGSLLAWGRESADSASKTQSPASTARPETLPRIVRYRLKARFEDLTLAAQAPAPGLNAAGHPHIGVPGFENLSGSLDADESAGSLRIDANQAAITARGLFEQPRIALNTLAANAVWQLSNVDGKRAFDASLESLRFANDDATGSAALRLTGNAEEPGLARLDLSGSFEQAQVARVARYLPTSIGAQLRHLLDHALQGGVARQVSFEAHGPLHGFPYQHDPKAGQFRIVAPFTGGRFDPSPFPPQVDSHGVPQRWPVFQDIDGSFELDRNRLMIRAPHARYRRVTLTDVLASIDDLPDFSRPLAITGHASGPLADMLAYVNESPLAAWAQQATRKLSASGNAKLQLNLDMARHHLDGEAARQTSHADVSGALEFAGNTLSVAQAPPLTALNGKVEFTQASFRMVGLRGQWLGDDVHASGGLDSKGVFDITAHGRLRPESLRAWADAAAARPLLARLSGSAPYRLTLRSAPHGLPETTLVSDMKGLAIDLPAPFGKPAGTSMPLTASTHPVQQEPAEAQAAASGSAAALLAAAANAAQQLHVVDLVFGPLRAHYLLRWHPTLSVQSGAMAVGTALPPATHGVAAALELPSLDADAWRLALAAIEGEAGAADAGGRRQPKPPNLGPAAIAVEDPRRVSEHAPLLAQFLPERLRLRIGLLRALSRNWNDIDLQARHEDNQAWRIDLDSKQAAGRIDWQGRDNGTLHARMSRLQIPLADAGQSKPDQPPSAPPPTAPRLPRRYPAIDLVVDDFRVGERNFGRLQVAAHNSDALGRPVWHLDSVQLSNPAARFSATGSWHGILPPTPSSDAVPAGTDLKFDLQIADAGALLARLGFARTLRHGSGTLAGEVKWNGDPLTIVSTIDYPSLNGSLAFKLEHGQILRVNPGVGKLLSVLSLQGLASFLQLDFSGVLGEGLPFDTASATGVVVDGVARTDDFRLVSSPAIVTMAGYANLAQETQQIDVTIAPRLNAASASIAAAVVNPLIGLSSLLAQVVFAEPLSRSLTRRYHVSGPWAAPVIERVQGNRGNIDPSSADRPADAGQPLPRISEGKQ